MVDSGASGQSWGLYHFDSESYSKPNPELHRSLNLQFCLDVIDHAEALGKAAWQADTLSPDTLDFKPGHTTMSQLCDRR